MERIANQDENSDWQNGTVTSDDYFRGRESVKATLLNAAGPLSPFLAGFISTLAEYIDCPMQDGSLPNLYRWKPESVMTKREIKAWRELFSDGLPEEADQVLLLIGDGMNELIKVERMTAQKSGPRSCVSNSLAFSFGIFGKKGRRIWKAWRRPESLYWGTLRSR